MTDSNVMLTFEHKFTNISALSNHEWLTMEHVKLIKKLKQERRPRMENKFACLFPLQRMN